MALSNLTLQECFNSLGTHTHPPPISCKGQEEGARSVPAANLGLQKPGVIPRDHLVLPLGKRLVWGYCWAGCHEPTKSSLAQAVRGQDAETGGPECLSLCGAGVEHGLCKTWQLRALGLSRTDHVGVGITH